MTSPVDPSNSEIQSAPTLSFYVLINLMNTDNFQNANKNGLNISQEGNLELFGNVCKYSGYESGVLNDNTLQGIRNINNETDLAVWYRAYDPNKIFAIDGGQFLIDFIKRIEIPKKTEISLSSEIKKEEISLSSEIKKEEISFSVSINLTDDDCFKEANARKCNIIQTGNLELYGNVCRYSGYESGDLSEYILKTIGKIAPGTHLTLIYRRDYEGKIFALTGGGVWISFIKRVAR